MTYDKRIDGRAFNALRPMSAEVGIIKNAMGSARFSIGKTVAIAAVYGPRDLFPKFLQDPKRAKLRCTYNMMAFSGSGERVRPGTSRRSKEISMVMEKALTPVLDLYSWPKAVIEVYVELLQTDAGTRCAGICAASLALADAGFEMKDMVCAVSAGLVGGRVVLDLDKAEEDYPGGAVDIPIAMAPRTGEITLLQLDGEINKEQLMECISFARNGCEQIQKVQREALLAKYEGVSQ